ncbi:hypothetical protein HOLleu_44782 [Holothuria leucospilota]|uniref:Uncharacterized protein n=1 Tax=Holothuria leucospilota TaxID=206669 RepID=A0A9Q0Y8L3_HOLLE|nr:hypothetical protein HOLleu_44782 [Holothuria leucospilota]
MIYPSVKGFAPEMPVRKAMPKDLEAAMEVPSSNRIYAIAKMSHKKCIFGWDWDLCHSKSESLKICIEMGLEFMP